MNTKDRYAERIMDAYVLLMLCFFPLFTLRGYRDILKDRFKAFCILTGGAAVFLLLVFLYRFFFEGDFLYRRRAAKRGAKKEEKKPSPGPRGLRERISAFFPACRLFFEDLEKALRETGIVKKPLSTDLPMLLLIVVYLVSMLRSGYLYETFWGIWGAQEGKSGGGRCMGFLTWFMIFLAYFMLSRIYRAKLWHILLGLFTGILVCLWGITDFFKMNLFHFFDGVAPVYWETFASSVGNINSYTSLTAVYMALFTVLHLREEKNWLRLFYFAGMLISYMACFMGKSDNVALSFAVLFALLPLYAWRWKGSFLRYWESILVFLSCMWMLGFLTKSETIPHIGNIYENGILLRIALDSKMLPIAIFLLLFLIGLMYYLFLRQGIRKTGGSMGEKEYLACFKQALPGGRLLVRIWGILLLLSILSFMILLYIANSGRPLGVLEPYRNVLVLSDTWGTGRGMNWKFGMQYFIKKMDLLQKLIGMGPESYYAVTMDNFFQQMVEAEYGVFDAAHNEYLNYLVTIGILGLLFYLVFCVRSLRILFGELGKKLEDRSFPSDWCAAVGFSFLVYLVQASVNIAVPIVLPLVLVILFTGLSAARGLREAP